MSESRRAAVKALLVTIKSAEIYTTQCGKAPEIEGTAVEVGINALIELGVKATEIRKAIEELGW